MSAPAEPPQGQDDRPSLVLLVYAGLLLFSDIVPRIAPGRPENDDYDRDLMLRIEAFRHVLERARTQGVDP